MPYVLVLMYCLAGAPDCKRIDDLWHPDGYETLQVCEERRALMTSIIIATGRVKHLVSRCELAGEEV